MSSVNPVVGNVNDVMQTKKAGKEKTNNLDKDAFLKILITQLKNQDPSQPLEDKQFIAQMATFSSLEQLTNISSEIKGLRESMGMTSNLIGKQITWLKSNGSADSKEMSGIVDSILMKQGKPYAGVKGEEVPLDGVGKISAVEVKP